MILALSLWSGAAAACDHPTTKADLDAALTASEGSFRTMDLAGFQKGFSAASSALSCEGEAVDAHEAARFHRAAGLAAFFGRDSQGAQRAFAAARALEPGFSWDPTAAPAGGPVQIAYSTISVENPQRAAFAAPAAGFVRVDGAPASGSATSRPAAWPAVVQLFSATGSVVSTGWIRADEPMPALPAAPAVVAAPAPAPAAAPTGPSPAMSAPPAVALAPAAPAPPAVKVAPVVAPLPTKAPEPAAKVAKKGSLRTPIWIGAGVAAVAAGALYGGAYATEQDYLASHDYHEMEELKGTNQALFWSSVGAAGLAVVGGVAGAVSVNF